MSESEIKVALKNLDEDLKANKITKEEYEKKKADLQKKLELLEES
jgi:hypothetical protein